MITIDLDACERYFRSLTVAQSFAWMGGCLVSLLVLIGLCCFGVAVCADLQSALLKREAKKAAEGVSQLRDTIKAQDGYRIVRVQNTVTGEVRDKVLDGYKTLFIAKRVSYEEYESNLEDNECFCLFEVFTTKNGDQYLYWGDLETDEEFITLNQKRR